MEIEQIATDFTMNNTGWPLESAPYYALVNTLRSVASRARREALEEACAAECRLCNERAPISGKRDGWYWHKTKAVSMSCRASNIRDLMEEKADDE
jgi:hypothetical protein